ncbi:MAG: TlpA disulfide reductase family protein [Saprospiraceae bacterium]|nr:TlpA family protein disulfide reductase [Saprospiraceae bacterium]MCB9345690.1 TlpA family protein disulfide reductase [Lewinellaceae bacterium]
MKQLLQILFFFTLGTSFLVAQEITFIDREQITRWKNSESDTVFVINFWATWCGPCVKELPAFEKLQEEYADKQVQVILVNNDFKKQFESRVIPFVQERNLKSRVVFMNESNPNKWIDLVSEEWSGALPATIIISGKKKQTLFFEKSFEYEELEKALLRVL